MVDSNLSTKVELFISGRDLKNTDTFSKSDPFCSVSLKSSNSTFAEIGRTESLKDTLNPNWSTSIQLDYFFESVQTLQFTVLDLDERSSETLGHAITTLGNLVSKGTSFLDLDTKGKIVVRVEEIKKRADIVVGMDIKSYTLQFRGIHLDKKDFFGKSDPFLIFYRNIGNNQWNEVHRTEVIMETLDPVWSCFVIPIQVICNNDMEKLIKIECFDWDKHGDPEFIGEFQCTFPQLVLHDKRFELHNTKDRNKVSGHIEVVRADISEQYPIIRSEVLSIPTFIDFLRDGLQISLIIAIDFTGSNGEYSYDDSLHHLSPTEKNQYEQAIYQVGNILEVYDSDKKFPVFGFGGIPLPSSDVEFCFPLNGNKSAPEVLGVQGIIDVYHQSQKNVLLAGPTYFEKIMKKAAKISDSTDRKKNYYILLLITDGEINDMESTIFRIVAASKMPLSIIIIGVGNSSFSMMRALDSDEGKLKDHYSNTAIRDIVQFVPFIKFASNPGALAAEVLKELPNQVVEYMKYIDHTPNPVIRT